MYADDCQPALHMGCWTALGGGGGGGGGIFWWEESRGLEMGFHAPDLSHEVL